MRKKSILRQLFFAFSGFGLFMGIVFPFYANFFVEWKPGMLIWFTIGCLVAGSTIGIVSFIIAKQVLIKKIARIAVVADAISQRDISFQCIIESDDVIGEIADSMNRMTKSLREVIAEINGITENLNQVSHELREKTKVTNDGVEAQKAEMLHIHDQLQQIKTSSESSLTAAENSTRILEEKMQNMSSSINTLSSHNEDISDMLESIAHITGKTNILAINASIESARAGEQGRGFSVVANEIRQLAEKTQVTTNKVLETSRILREQSEQALNNLDTSDQQDKTRSVAYINEVISQARQQQSGAVKEITDKLDDIEKILANTDTGSHQILNQSEILARQVHSCTEIIRSFKFSE